MPNTLRIKRRASNGGAGAPASLANAELAYNEHTNILYYGWGTGGLSGTATQVIPIGGSGAYSYSDGSNAAGTWGISITGNAGSVTNGVYTSRTLTPGSGLVGSSPLDLSANRTFDVGQGDGISVGIDSIAVNNTVVRTSGDQTIQGRKTFFNRVDISGTASSSPPSGARLDFIGDGGGDISFNTPTSNIYFSSNGQSYITKNTASSEGIVITDPNGIVLRGSSSSSFPNTNVSISGNLSVSGSGNFSSGIAISNQTSNTIASFDANKNVVSLSTSTYPTLTELSYVKGVTSSIQTQINGLVPNSRTLTPGSGLVGSSPLDLSANRTLDIGQGDGISVTSDSISVDGTVVRTSDTQTINGAKTFGNSITFSSGLSVNNNKITSLAEPTASGDAATKNYVDTAITSGIATNDAMIFKGAIDCSSNPNYPAADRGWTYKVSVAGKIGGASGPSVEVNDTLICTTDGTAAGTHASVGSNWVILQTNIADASILVTGPASATNNNFALFDGVTGKIIKDAGFGSGVFYSSSNPSGYTTNVGTVTSVGGTGSVAGLTLTGTVTTAGNLTLGGTLSTPVSSINDSTTVGQNLVKLTNPSAIRFLRINANNTVDTLTDSDFRTAIGAGTSSTVGTVTSITAGSGMNFTSVTSSGPVTLGTPSNITLSSTNSLTSNSHTHAFAPGGTTEQYIRGDGVLATLCDGIANCTIDGGTF